ncbi:MAG: MFS transporter [Streptosporangiaceae bacterium]
MSAGRLGADQRSALRSALRSGPLAVRSFRLLAGGQFASTVGDFCYAVALPWLVLSSHGGAVLLGIVLACYGVPRTVLIPVGGVLADKIGPRTLMLIADTARCVLLAAMVVLAARHTVSLAALGPIAALIGAGEGLFIPASFSIMPSLLDGEQLAAGNALAQAATQIGSLAGPVLGGVLVAVTHASTWAFAVDAVSFALSALSLLLIPRRAAVSAGPADETAGRPAPSAGVLALLKRSRVLQVLLVVVVAANLAGGGMSEVALPALAHDRFGAAGYGALLACFAAGSLLGALAATRAGHLRTPAVFAGLVFVAEGVTIALIPHLGGEAGAAAALFAGGACNGLGNLVLLTVLQKWAPPALLGRIMGAVMLCAFGSFPLSVAVSGVLVRHLGPAAFFPVAGGLVIVAVLGGLTQREFRAFGAAGSVPAPGGADAPEPAAAAEVTDAALDPRAVVDAQAAEDSRK